MFANVRKRALDAKKSEEFDTHPIRGNPRPAEWSWSLLDGRRNTSPDVPIEASGDMFNYSVAVFHTM
jgi:hypothetical protein